METSLTKRDNSSANICECINFVFERGTESKAYRWNKFSNLFNVIGKQLPSELSKVPCLNREYFHIKGVSGASGSWSKLMYIAILDSRLSRGFNGLTPTIGIYPALIFSQNCDSVFLTYMIGVGMKKEKELRRTVSLIRDRLEYDGFDDDYETLKTIHDNHLYDLATVFFKQFDKASLVDPERFMDALEKTVQIHEEFVSSGSAVRCLYPDKQF